MVWEQLDLWKKILLYGFVLIALFVYAKLSNLKVRNVPLVPLHYRIFLALFFPFILVLFFFFGAALLTFVLLIAFIIYILSLLQKRRIRIKRIRI